MYDQQIRINAAISYFFLGPLFLFSKKQYAISNDFVQWHARRATFHILGALIVFAVLYLLRQFLYFEFFGIFLYDIIMSAFFAIFFFVQMFGAYRAFYGKWFDETTKIAEDFSQTISRDGYSEELKIQITLSFLPIISAFIAERNPLPEIIIGRKVSHFFLFLLIVSWVLAGTTINILSLIILIGFIVLIVTNAVWIFAKNSFLFLKIYKFIPTYHEFEAKIFAFFIMTKEFFQIAFGKQKEKNFQNEYSKILAKNSQKIPFSEKFWTHPAIIAIPFVNIITIPSFFQKKFHEYQWNIVEWFFLTILCAIIIFAKFSYFWLYFMIFPIITLIAQAKKNSQIRAPITSVSRNIFIFSYRAKQKIEDLQNSKSESVVTFSHKNPEKIAEIPENWSQENSQNDMEKVLKNL